MISNRLNTLILFALLAPVSSEAANDLKGYPYEALSSKRQEMLSKVSQRIANFVSKSERSLLALDVRSLGDQMPFREIENSVFIQQINQNNVRYKK
jgi:hypothetical protein